MTVKRAHMVSKGYIRAWTDAGNRVDVLNLQDGRGFPTSFENATVVRFGYDTEVLTHDLEGDYGRIESSGIPAIVKLRNGHALTAVEQSAVVAFLDMHLDRGRYADQTKIRIPAVVLKAGGLIEHAKLTVGDRLLLSRSLPDVLRLTTLGLEQWPMAGERGAAPRYWRRRGPLLAANRRRRHLHNLFSAVPHQTARNRTRPA